MGVRKGVIGGFAVKSMVKMGVAEMITIMIYIEKNQLRWVLASVI